MPELQKCECGRYTRRLINENGQRTSTYIQDFHQTIGATFRESLPARDGRCDVCEWHHQNPRIG